MITSDRVRWGILGTGGINRRFLGGGKPARRHHVVLRMRRHEWTGKAQGSRLALLPTLRGRGREVVVGRRWAGEKGGAVLHHVIDPPFDVFAGLADVGRADPVRSPFEGSDDTVGADRREAMFPGVEEA